MCVCVCVCVTERERERERERENLREITLAVFASWSKMELYMLATHLRRLAVHKD